MSAREIVEWTLEASGWGKLSALEQQHWIDAQPAAYDWPTFDENTASSLCYTSGTTGNPKGVLYSHRSTVLHTLSASIADIWELRSSDCVLPVTPMFLFGVFLWGPVQEAQIQEVVLAHPAQQVRQGLVEPARPQVPDRHLDQGFGHAVAAERRQVLARHRFRHRRLPQRARAGCRPRAYGWWSRSAASFPRAA